jgi:tetratricopeptide (TPR) repeat protein
MKFSFWIAIVFPIVVSAQADCAQAEKYFRQGNFASSENLFKTYLASHPGNEKALEYLGDIRCHAQDWNGAAALYKQLCDLSPRNAGYWYKYGGALGMEAKTGNKFQALAMIPEIRGSFERAIALDPNHIDARWALIELYLQLPGIVGGSESKAQRYAGELQRISPVDGYLAKGRIAEYFERWKSAEKFYKLAMDAGGSKLTYQKLADLYKNKMNQPGKARETMAAYAEKTKS